MKKTFSVSGTSGYLAAIALSAFVFASCERLGDDEAGPKGNHCGSGHNAAPAPSPSTAKMTPGAATRTYVATLSALNSSGVSGTVLLTLQGNNLMVEVQASGLEPNQTHMQHIHGFTDNKGNATCPPASADADYDGLISLAEGLPFYGQVLVPLVPYPMVDQSGTVNFSQTYTLGSGGVISMADLMPLQNRVIVLHGLSVNGSYVASLPVACAQIQVLPPMR